MFKKQTPVESLQTPQAGAPPQPQAQWATPVNQANVSPPPGASTTLGSWLIFTTFLCYFVATALQDTHLRIGLIIAVGLSGGHLLIGAVLFITNNRRVFPYIYECMFLILYAILLGISYSNDGAKDSIQRNYNFIVHSTISGISVISLIITYPAGLAHVQEMVPWVYHAHEDVISASYFSTGFIAAMSTINCLLYLIPIARLEDENHWNALNLVFRIILPMVFTFFSLVFALFWPPSLLSHLQTPDAFDLGYGSKYPANPYGPQPRIYDNAMYATPPKGVQPVTAAYNLKAQNNPMYQPSYAPGQPIGVPYMGAPQYMVPAQMGPNGQMQMIGPNGPVQMGPNSQMLVGPNGQVQYGPNGQMQVGPKGPMQVGPNGQPLQGAPVQGQPYQGQMPQGYIPGKQGPNMPVNGMQMGLAPNNGMQMGMPLQPNSQPAAMMQPTPQQLLQPSQPVLLQAAPYPSNAPQGPQLAARPMNMAQQPQMLQPLPPSAGMQVPGPQQQQMLGPMPPPQQQLQGPQYQQAAQVPQAGPGMQQQPGLLRPMTGGPQLQGAPQMQGAPQQQGMLPQQQVGMAQQYYSAPYPPR